MAWTKEWVEVDVCRDDLTGAVITPDLRDVPTVLAFEGQEYELDLLPSTRADIWEQLRVVLCRARPLGGAPAIDSPETVARQAALDLLDEVVREHASEGSTDNLGSEPSAAKVDADPEPGGEKAEGDDPADEPLPTAVRLDALTGPQGPAVRPREPDWQARAEELLEQNWTPARVSRELGVELAEVRELLPSRKGPRR